MVKLYCELFIYLFLKVLRFFCCCCSVILFETFDCFISIFERGILLEKMPLQLSIYMSLVNDWVFSRRKNLFFFLK